VWRLAYGKIGRKWGFIIEYTEDDQADPDGGSFESWPFAESPREKRISAISSIPDLLVALVKKSNDFAAKISEKLKYSKELAVTISQLTAKAKK
jgi:hypothetical protein